MSENQSSDQQPCLELRIAVHAIDETAFTALTEQFQAMGRGEESDVQTSKSVYIAWFNLVSDTTQRAQIISMAMLLGVNEADISLQLLDDSWETAWQKDWQAQAIGQRLCIRPSFCPTLPDRDVDIVLEPGMAFGTGTHPTTRLCLEAMEQYCQPSPPNSVLDMGAGSGLLAIAAIKLGAQGVLAIDYDADSVAACHSNALINHVTLAAELGDTPPVQTFELVVANILAGPLLNMAKGLAACTEKTLILSGLLVAQQTSICEAYQAHGLHLIQQWQQSGQGDDWIALAFERTTTIAD
ncbi:MAG: 50S ribosomal protein L11 methyltransferase [Mariprofundaceae bacterium]|nr:50S ribosomal protein L11 methyltransferase [Mariprofundaceae bacterium]